jgi:hypothetical protein
LDNNKLFTFEEAKLLCSGEEESSKMIIIHSREEQEFISNYLFEYLGLANEVWIGLKKVDDEYKWIDDSELNFTNWANGSPSNRSDYNCVQLTPEVFRFGEWVEKLCDRKNIAVCQKLPTISAASLEKSLKEAKKQLNDTKDLMSETRRQYYDLRDILSETRFHLNKTAFETKIHLNDTREQLRETRKLLIETREQLDQTRRQLNDRNSKFSKYLNTLLSKRWIHYKLFTDSDGKHKALFIPFNKNGDIVDYNFNDAVDVCSKFNATLVEVQSLRKQWILESFLGQLGLVSDHLQNFWLNARKDESGNWKWIKSDKEFTFTNWHKEYPLADIGCDYLFLHINGADGLVEWRNFPISSTFYVVCEMRINI